MEFMAVTYYRKGYKVKSAKDKGAWVKSRETRLRLPESSPMESHGTHLILLAVCEMLSTRAAH